MRPDVDHLVVALAVRDQTFLVLILDLIDLFRRLSEEALLVRRDPHIIDADRHASARCVAIPESSQRISKKHRRLIAHAAVALVDQLTESLLVHHLIDEFEWDVFRHDFAHQNAARRRRRHLAVDRHFDRGVNVENSRVVRDDDFLFSCEPHALAMNASAFTGHVITAEHDVLCRANHRAASCRAEDVIRRHHQHARFDLRFDRKRYVDRHLIAVEVRVERGANERVKLNRLALDQHGLESLHAEPMQRRCAVEENRMLLDHLSKNVPNLGAFVLNHLPRGLNGRHESLLLELGINKGLEELECHAVRKAALM